MNVFIRATCAIIIGIACGMLAHGMPPARPPAPPSFDEPFAADSCWKTPVPDDAEYIDVTYEWRKLKGFGIAANKWCVGFYRATEADPAVKVILKDNSMWRLLNERKVQNAGNSEEAEALLLDGAYAEPRYVQNYYSTPATSAYLPIGRSYTSTIRCPRGARPLPDSDGHLAVLHPDGRVFEAYAAAVLANGDVACGIAGFTDLAGPGDGTCGGRRASMLPSFAGLIRRTEIARGRIDHALVGLMFRGCLMPAAHVWPAIAHDTNSGYSGSIPLGARLAIARNIDLTALGLTPRCLMIARALQQYGMILGDRGGEGMTIVAELGCDEIDPATNYPQWWTVDSPELLPLLRMVKPPAAGPGAIALAPCPGEPGFANPPAMPLLRVGRGCDYADVASAVAALPASGGTVIVAAGIYRLTESIRLPSNVALIGEGHTARLEMAPGVAAHVIANADQDKGNENVLVRNLAIVGNLGSAGKPPGNDNTIKGNENCRGIWFRRVRGALVEGCLITEAATNSIAAHDCERIMFRRNTVINCWHCCNWTRSRACIIADNYFLKQWSGDGVYFNDSHDSLILRNWAEGMGAPGIALEFNSSGNVVYDNACVANSFHGIALKRGSRGNAIASNLCAGNGRFRGAGQPDGIFLGEAASENCITGNRCFDDQPQPSQRYGINISSAGCKNNVITENHLEGNAAATTNDAGTGTVIIAVER